MWLSDNTYEFIKFEVCDLIIRYDINSMPISGFEIAKKMGIILVPYSALSKMELEAAKRLSYDGFYLEPGDGKEYIYYADDVNYERINMTILHEIGHCVLGHDDETPQSKAEAEARFFAKYAIAPPPLVHRIKPKCSADIKKYFCISDEAAYYAFSYYKKWLNCSNMGLKPYEQALLLHLKQAI